MGQASTTSQQQPPISRHQPESAFQDARAHLRLWLVAAVGVAADLWTKHWAFTALEADKPRHWIPHLLDLQLSLNPGALFGLGSGMVVLFIVASLAALVFVMYLFAGTASGQWGVHLALALILAGALGNLYDRAFEQYEMVKLKAGSTPSSRPVIGEVVDDGDTRTVAVRPWFDPGRLIKYSREDLDGPVRRVGVVRDFLKFTPQIDGRWIWPWVFNVADALLVVGVSLLLLCYWSGRRRRPPPAAPAA